MKTLQSHHQCALCAGCQDDETFDYCRACGYFKPVSNEEARKWLAKYAPTEPPPKGTLERTIWDANGGPLQPPLQRGFA